MNINYARSEILVSGLVYCFVKQIVDIFFNKAYYQESYTNYIIYRVQQCGHRSWVARWKFWKSKVDLKKPNTRCISITDPSRWTSTLRDFSGTSNGSLVDFWGKLKNLSLYFYDFIRSKMSRNCILSVTELSYYYICHFYRFIASVHTQNRHL
jgi:hypothetical protein